MSSTHGKTDSDVTSLAASSPRRPAYYVQSPSRDSSNDGEKTTNSFHSTPVLSPMGSPPHSSSSVGPRSSSTRFSGSFKPASSRKFDAAAAGNHHRKGRRLPWKAFTAIEEEGLLEEYGGGGREGLSRRCYFLAFVGGFLALFSVFSLILWGASRSQKPSISMKSIAFDHFTIQAGTDFSGVATDMISMNSTVKLTFRNAATFFGVHVTSTPLDLSFSRLTLATGTIKKFYQQRKSQRTIAVAVMGRNVPLYGGGASLSSSGGAAAAPVPLRLSFAVRSRAYVLGKLVKPKFYERVDCAVVLDPKKMSKALSLKNACSFR